MVEFFGGKKNKNKMEIENNYTLIHKGDGNFDVLLEDGSIKKAGENLCGMIRYTYFENFEMPELGWKVERKKLFEDYFPKVFADIQSGKVSIGEHKFKQ
jgi:hypothetical protein